jgi:hypothetical protein
MCYYSMERYSTPCIEMLTDTFTIAAATGIVGGLILSAIFGSYALPTRIPTQFTIAGYPLSVVLANLVLGSILGAIVLLGYVSSIVQDTTFPTKNPAAFITETVIVGIVPASVIYVITDFRDDGKLDLSTLNSDFILLATKFAIFHLLFQFSGLYTYMLTRHD